MVVSLDRNDTITYVSVLTCVKAAYTRLSVSIATTMLTLGTNSLQDAVLL